MVPKKEQCLEDGCSSRATKFVENGKDTDYCPAHANVSGPDLSEVSQK